MPSSLWEPVASDMMVERIKAAAALEPQTLSRRDICQRVMAILGNDFEHLVEEALKAMFHPDNYAKLKLFPHTATNVMGRVLADVCRLYQEAPSRYLKGVTDANERETATGRLSDLLDQDDVEILAAAQAAAEAQATPEPAAPEAAPPAAQAFERLLGAIDLDEVFDEAQRLASVLPCVWLFPVVRERADGKIGIDVDFYTPFNASVKLRETDKTQAEAFYTWVYRTVGTERKLYYYEWTRTTIRKYDADWKPVVDGDPVVGDGVNHLGRLPVTAVRLGRVLDSYFLDGQGGDLYDGTIEVAVLRTLQNARFRDSSFKQLVIDGNPADIPPDQVMGNPATPIYVNDATASVLDLQPAFDQQSAVVKERIEGLAQTYGISPASWSMTERAQSGFSKKMDSAKILSRNRKQRKWLARAEADLYRLIAIGAAARVYQDPALSGLDPEAQFVIDYADPKFEEEPKAQAEADARDIAMGKTSILDVILRENPDLTEEEGLALLARNRLINMRFAGTGSMQKGASILEILAASGTSQRSADGRPPPGDEGAGAGGAGSPAGRGAA